MSDSEADLTQVTGQIQGLRSAQEYREQGDYELNVLKRKQRAFDYYALGEKDWKDDYCRYKLALMHLEGVYAHDSMDRIEETIRLLKINAKNGHWEACQKLGELYCDEIYGKQDLDEALVWFSQAAANKSNLMGASETCYCVANLFKEGTHFERNYKQALTWYEQAVELGHIDSLYFMAVIYHEGGFGVQQSTSEAIIYYLNAVYQMEDCTYYAEAANALGDIYRYGEDVDVDYKEAFKWYQKAANSEYPSRVCLLNLASMYSQGLGTEVDLELAQIWTGLAYEKDD